MWKKYLFITILFYLFALLQNSFFGGINYSFLTPNLVFIYFFSLLFFTNKKNYNLVIFSALMGGFLLDLFSNSYFGPSMIILLLFAILLKNIQFNFLVFFIVSWIFYVLLTNPYNLIKVNFFYELLINIFFAFIFLIIFKKVKQLFKNEII
jgi:hypothetical protein